MATAIPVGRAAPGPRRRRRAWTLVAVIGAVLGLAALAVAADLLGRQMAEAEFEHQLEENLPPGVTGTFDVDIHGLSFLAQLIGQRYEEVEVSSGDLAAAGVPLVLHGTLYDVTTGAVPVAGRLEGDLRLSPEAANSLVTIPGATSELAFGDGTVAFTSSVEVLGFPMAVDAIGSVGLDGREIVVDLTSLRFQAGGLEADPQDIWPELGDSRIPICVEQHLPQGVRLSDLSVAPDGVTASFAAEQLPLDEASLATRGSCDAG